MSLILSGNAQKALAALRDADATTGIKDLTARIKKAFEDHKVDGVEHFEVVKKAAMQTEKNYNGVLGTEQTTASGAKKYGINGIDNQGKLVYILATPSAPVVFRYRMGTLYKFRHLGLRAPKEQTPKQVKRSTEAWLRIWNQETCGDNPEKINQLKATGATELLFENVQSGGDVTWGVLFLRCWVMANKVDGGVTSAISEKRARTLKAKSGKRKAVAVSERALRKSAKGVTQIVASSIQHGNDMHRITEAFGRMRV